jgi:hypothetical protein
MHFFIASSNISTARSTFLSVPAIIIPLAYSAAVIGVSFSACVLFQLKICVKIIYTNSTLRKGKKKKKKNSNPFPKGSNSSVKKKCLHQNEIGPIIVN